MFLVRWVSMGLFGNEHITKNYCDSITLPKVVNLFEMICPVIFTYIDVPLSSLCQLKQKHHLWIKDKKIIAKLKIFTYFKLWLTHYKLNSFCEQY